MLINVQSDLGKQSLSLKMSNLETQKRKGVVIEDNTAKTQKYHI
jgi:hypothetical protein